MKKIKLLTPILGLTATLGALAPLASCSCGTTEEGAKANVTVSSTDGVKIKEQSVELNKDSTVTLTVPDMKAIRTVYVHVGTVVLTEDRDFTVDYNENIVKINGSVLKDKDIEITVFTTKQDGITASLVESGKTFEALETIKASDINVYATYEESTKHNKPLVYGSEYLVYDSEGVEVKDFDTVGYTVTRPDGRNTYKEFVIEYVPFDRYSCKLSVNTCKRLEPESIDSVNYDQVVFETSKITASDLVVNATMTKGEEKTKILEYGKDYLVYDGDKIIENFDTEGYTFTEKGNKTLTIKSVENPDEATKDINFGVQPLEYKNTVYLVNYDETTVKVTLNLKSTKLEYSLDNSDWTPYTDSINVEKGHSLAIRGKLTVDESNHIDMETDSETPDVKIYGNLLGLLDNGEGTAELTDGCFKGLLSYCPITYVTRHFLPSETLKPSCYERLFDYCSFLENAPVLPAKKMESRCYLCMLEGCESLKIAPELPATKLAEKCYFMMFSGCSKLQTAPELPATVLTTSCYENMFMRCTSLKVAPELPATVLADACYRTMFGGCSGLINAPSLPATKIKQYSYSSMFSSCTNLKKAPELPGTELDVSCYYMMFYGCSGLEYAPNLEAKNLYTNCYYMMFAYCTSLVNPPKLSAISLANSCCSRMFMSCSSLKTAPELPVMELMDYCYEYMFYGCTSLTSAPELPATQLTKGCYASMFKGCSSLEIVETAPEKGGKILLGQDTTSFSQNPYSEMFTETKGRPEEQTYQPQAGITYYWVEQE